MDPNQADPVVRRLQQAREDDHAQWNEERAKLLDKIAELRQNASSALPEPSHATPAPSEAVPEPHVAPPPTETIAAHAAPPLTQQQQPEEAAASHEQCEMQIGLLRQELSAAQQQVQDVTTTSERQLFGKHRLYVDMSRKLGALQMAHEKLLHRLQQCESALESRNRALGASERQSMELRQALRASEWEVNRLRSIVGKEAETVHVAQETIESVRHELRHISSEASVEAGGGATAMGVAETQPRSLVEHANGRGGVEGMGEEEEEVEGLIRTEEWRRQTEEGDGYALPVGVGSVLGTSVGGDASKTVTTTTMTVAYTAISGGDGSTVMMENLCEEVSEWSGGEDGPFLSSSHVVETEQRHSQFYESYVENGDAMHCSQSVSEVTGDGASVGGSDRGATEEPQQSTSDERRDSGEVPVSEWSLSSLEDTTSAVAGESVDCDGASNPENVTTPRPTGAEGSSSCTGNPLSDNAPAELFVQELNSLRMSDAAADEDTDGDDGHLLSMAQGDSASPLDGPSSSAFVSDETAPSLSLAHQPPLAAEPASPTASHTPHEWGSPGTALEVGSFAEEEGEERDAHATASWDEFESEQPASSMYTQEGGAHQLNGNYGGHGDEEHDDTPHPFGEAFESTAQLDEYTGPDV